MERLKESSCQIITLDQKPPSYLKEATFLHVKFNKAPQRPGFDRLVSGRVFFWSYIPPFSKSVTSNSQNSR